LESSTQYREQSNNARIGPVIREAQLDWHCVHIEHKRLAHPLDVTFRNMLTQEYRSFGEPVDCRVYRKRHGDGASTYFFSPEASEHLRIFLNFWEAFECPAPNPSGLELIIGTRRLSDG
jgi:hypothetical protein